MLAAEYVIAVSEVANCCSDIKSVAKRFGVNIGIEASVYRMSQGQSCVVIASFTTDANRLVEYSLSLLVVQLLIKKAIARGAKIYAVGIWNTPLISNFADSKRLAELKRAKRRFDPWGRLNPGKFFAIRSRFKNLSGLTFSPAFFRSLIAVAAWCSPLLGWVSRVSRAKASHKWHVPRPEEGEGIPLLAETAQRCTYCGSCVSVCPAYVITNDELVTARAKLSLANALIKDRPIEEREAFANFQCIRCGLCEEVCQTRLPLKECYEQLEQLVARRYGHYPHEVVEPFINKVDENRDWVLETFGLDAAPWSPDEMTRQLPGSRKLRGGQS
jgi:ferredoxin